MIIISLKIRTKICLGSNTVLRGERRKTVRLSRVVKCESNRVHGTDCVLKCKKCSASQKYEGKVNK